MYFGAPFAVLSKCLRSGGVYYSAGRSQSRLKLRNPPGCFFFNSHT